jgi:hypothetical protein
MARRLFVVQKRLHAIWKASGRSCGLKPAETLWPDIEQTGPTIDFERDNDFFEADLRTFLKCCVLQRPIESDRKEQEFFELAEKFRGTADPKETDRLGDKLGRIVFGGRRPR